METVEHVCAEIEKIIAAISSGGEVDEGARASLDKLSAAAETVGMKSGKKFVDNLSAALKDGKTGESLAVRVTALDFYIKNVLSGQGAVEDI